MQIAIIGTRGIPANYGGFETFAEELSLRLVEKGHKVTVYCRSNYTKENLKEYKGVKLVVLPTLKNKYSDTVFHTFLSTLHVIFTDVKVVYYCNAINSIFTFLPRLLGIKTIINVDGLEWKRQKWSRAGKAAYRIAEFIATIFANVIVSDSRGIANYYKTAFNKDTEYISYGADPKKVILPGKTLEKLKLKRKGYILYVSRLEPENNAHILVRAYEKVKGNMPLIIVGNAPYNNNYIKRLKDTKDKRIRFVGSIYGDGYFELTSNAFIYIHGNEVGGTNPALLQAMALGNCVIATGVEFNREVVGDCGLCYAPGNPNDLAKRIDYLLNKPEEVEKYRPLAIERMRRNYNWDAVVNKTENLMKKILK